MISLLPAVAARAVGVWDYARSAAPIIGQAMACGADADRVARAETQVRALLALAAHGGARGGEEHRKADELYVFMRDAAATQQRQRVTNDRCADVLATFADLERRLPLWRAALVEHKENSK